MEFLVNFAYPSYIEQLHWVDKSESRKLLSGAYDAEHKWKGVLEKYNSFLLAWLNAMVFWTMSSCHKWIDKAQPAALIDTAWIWQDSAPIWRLNLKAIVELAAMALHGLKAVFFAPICF